VLRTSTSPSTKTGKTKNDTLAVAGESVAKGICEHHADCVAANGDEHPRVTASDVRAASGLLAKHSEHDIRTAIDWCQTDGNWWRSRTLTMRKVGKHFDTIRVQQRDAARGSNGRMINNRLPSNPEEDARIIAAFNGQ
jgi:hypothetical protein